MEINIETTIEFYDKDYNNTDLSKLVSNIQEKLKDCKDYKTIKYNTKKYLINDAKKRKLDTTYIIDESIPDTHNVYFLLDNDNKILYVGKSLEIRKRLKEHLIECSRSTSSKISNVHDYLLKKDCLEIRYYTIEVKPVYLYGTVEGIIIAECVKQEIDIWNIRKG